MIYVDNLTQCTVTPNWRYKQSCHLMADGEDELIEFGKKIGCKVEWLQRSQTGLVHFDLTMGLRQQAVKAGAKEIDRRMVIELCHKAMMRKRQPDDEEILDEDA